MFVRFSMGLILLVTVSCTNQPDPEEVSPPENVTGGHSTPFPTVYDSFDSSGFKSPDFDDSQCMGECSERDEAELIIEEEFQEACIAQGFGLKKVSCCGPLACTGRPIRSRVCDK